MCKAVLSYGKRDYRADFSLIGAAFCDVDMVVSSANFVCRQASQKPSVKENSKGSSSNLSFGRGRGPQECEPTPPTL